MSNLVVIYSYKHKNPNLYDRHENRREDVTCIGCGVAVVVMLEVSTRIGVIGWVRDTGRAAVVRPGRMKPPCNIIQNMSVYRRVGLMIFLNSKNNYMKIKSISMDY